MGDLLQLSPPELKFRFELKKNIPVTLALTNPGTERVAFKVKTTSPKKYCVRPSTGYVDPGATKEVQVIMQAQREYPPSLSDCKDKFQVQSLQVGSDVSEVNADLFEPGSGKEIKNSKIRVVLVGPPKPPSPVPEGVEEEHPSPAKNIFSASSPNKSRGAEASDEDPNSDLAVVKRERNRLRDQLAKAESDRLNITKRLDAVDSTKAYGQQQKPLPAKTQLLPIIIAAFITFILGYLLRGLSS